MKFKPQDEFPLLNIFKEKFAIKETTCFAFDNIVYTDCPMSDDLIIHEQTHFEQQEKYGLANWVNQYLNNNEFRLKMELQAYKKQLASIKNREKRNFIKIRCAQDLASDMYGDIIDYQQAIKELTL